jgi:hypothetical protein
MTGHKAVVRMGTALLLAVPVAGAALQQATDGGGGRPMLTVLAPGILSTGSGMFAGLEANRPLGRTYRIRLVSDAPIAKHPSGIQQLLSGSAADPAGTDTIEVSNPDDPRLKRFIERMVRERDVSVAIDMDLVGTDAGPWADQTTRLARIAADVAEARLRAHPTSFNSIFTHSAATLGLARLIDAGKGGLFHEKVAAAPQTDQLSSDVVILQAIGDLPSTPTGNLTDLEATGPSRNSRMWMGRGNTVIQVNTDGLEVDPTNLLQSLVAVPFQVPAHERANELGVHDRNLRVMVPVSFSIPGEPPSPTRYETFEIANASPAQVLKVLEGRAGPVAPLAETDRRRTDFDRLKELRAQMERLEPPRGGGVALWAAARLPVDPGEVATARWDEKTGRLVLLRRGGGAWTLPRMHPDIARTAYQSVFGERARDPEFSIGASLVRGADDASASGRQPAYYQGPVENTLFGRVLLAADMALGEMAYGSTRDLAARGLDGLPGYHSLAEMFPEKYAVESVANRHAGTADRVVLQSLPSRLVRAPGDELVWARVPELAVRFGRTTPAERGYAALFAAHYFALVERMPELRDLLECSRAVGTFKWLRENRVRLEGDAALRTPPGRVFTPHQVDEREPISELALFPLSPRVRYGAHGPLEVHPAHGGPTLVTYARGHVRTVARGDGRTFTVHTDDLGRPVAVEADGFGAAALVHGNRGEMTVVDGVVLLTRGGRVVGFRRRSSSRQGPAGEAWELVESLAQRFIETGTQPDAR